MAIRTGAGGDARRPSDLLDSWRAPPRRHHRRHAMRVLVSAASRHGSTADIAVLVADGLRDAGLDVDLEEPQDVGPCESYDAFVLGSGVYAGRWLPAMHQFIDSHVDVISSKPTWLFSSGPLGDPPKPAEDPADVRPIVEQTHAREHRVFAGRLDRDALRLGEKVIVAAVRAPAGDFRAPADILDWAAHIARSIEVATAQIHG